jgi:hypothetical protein
MNILIDKNRVFDIEIKGNSVHDSNDNYIGFSINDKGNVSVLAKCVGRDFETMSSVIEEASIINSVTGKPLLRSKIFCKLIVSKFVKQIIINSENDQTFLSVNSDTLNNMPYDLVKNIAMKWLSVTDGRK